MAEETITILKVGTEEAVKNINDLRNNIKTLKENLEDLEIGTQEYKDTLDELKVNQNALKDAMYATTSSMDDVAAAATGASKSYNSLSLFLVVSKIVHFDTNTLLYICYI